MHSDLSLLTSGKPVGTQAGGLADILTHVRTSIDYLVEQIAWLSEQEPQRISMLGPFFGRSLLELASTALIGRLDPLRLLVVRQIQAQPEYNTKNPSRMSVRWQGDVVGDKIAKPWADGVDYEKVTKALLGDYYDHLLWRPALQNMLGASTASTIRGAWLAQLANIDPDKLVSRKRDEIKQLHSALSKGLHHEFVLPPGALYDLSTVKDLILRAVHVTADLGLISHFIEHASYSLDHTEAFAAFSRIETMEVMK